MKNQYFGDINDYRKYGLLRALQGVSDLSLLVAWMLTPDDGRSDGKRTTYLKDSDHWEDFDPELYEALRQLLVAESDQRIQSFQSAKLLPRTRYFSLVVPDDSTSRAGWLLSLQEDSTDVDLVFLDPDNGIEIPSKKVGHKDSSKYVCWSEIEGLWEQGSSLLIYQHFGREKRSVFIPRIEERLRKRLDGASVFSLATSNVLFLVAAQKRHAETLRAGAAAAASQWKGQIRFASGGAHAGGLDDGDARKKSVRESLETARKELLDLSLRNTLISFRQLKSKGVEVVDELPEEIFRMVVSEGRSMTFLAAPEPENGDQLLGLADELLFLQPEDDDEDGGIATRHIDTKLQTPHSSAVLQRRLLNTFYAARTHIEELGVNTLYLALGMLRWYESPASEIERQAPLLLVPVLLERSSVRSKFRVSYTDDDIGTNLSLGAKLRSEFGIDLPEVSEDEISVGSYFSEVAKAVTGHPRWRVDEAAIALGFFSFTRFLMYQDLDPSNWSCEEGVIAELLGEGFESGESIFPELERLDDHPTQAELRTIVDADSSQTLAMLQVEDGSNLVIQGPPGTGKSQTIANIIANSIAKRKKVLFVSEKMAALDVVKRRLDFLGIGDACIELHSHRTNKKRFLQELERTSHLGRPHDHPRVDELPSLKQHKKRLNDYCDAVSTAVGTSETAPYEAYGRALDLRGKLHDVAVPDAEPENCGSWSRAAFQRRLDRVRELEAHIGRIGRPTEHRFWGSQRTLALPDEIVDVGRKATHLSDECRSLTDILERARSQFGIEAAATIAGAKQVESSLRVVGSAPDVEGVSVANASWGHEADNLLELISTGGAYATTHAALDDILYPESWEEAVLGTRKELAPFDGKWWRWLSGKYRRARREAQSLFSTAPPKTVAELLSVLDSIMDVQRSVERLGGAEELLGSLFGQKWMALESAWDELAGVAQFLIDTHQAVADRTVSASLLGALEKLPDRFEVAELAASVGACTNRVVRVLEEAEAMVEIDLGKRFGSEDSLRIDLAQLLALAEGWAEAPDSLQEIVTYNLRAKTLCESGLETVVEVATEWEHGHDHLANWFAYRRYLAIITEAMKSRPVLAAFETAAHEAVVKRFQELDELQFEVNKTLVAAAHFEGLPRPGGSGQLGTLRHEFGKRRRHLPIRRLLAGAGRAVQAIKPVFMMSPLSIAAYVPPGSLEFDLVVFDEASQVRPVDAFGAILRGDQIVVVGDSKQLPPTSFFEKLDEGDDEEESRTGDLESILRLFVAQGAPESMLRWHYRSRHESLIAVSNHEFYDNKLVVFPSPDASRDHVGLRFRHLPDTEYMRGTGRSFNRGEAREVAKAVFKHARETHSKSLGVASFSQAQMDVIRDQVELLRREDPTCENFFGGHPDEPFFVKNLERVQGDERDVIFISVGYGRTKEGYVAMNFGALNRDGGERRLNVLITRARERCVVFSNLTADDIDLDRSQSRGVAALRTYLRYAELGILDTLTPSGGEADSPFEEAVASALIQHGYEVVDQVSSGGFFVDLGVRDPAKRGRFLLGIECDGASYHSARWARDRDRLRQKVLENLGWTIHRVWSTDWFKNQDRELRRLLERLEMAKVEDGATSDVHEDRTANAAPGPEQDTSPGVARADEPESEDHSGASPYEMANLSISLGTYALHTVPKSDLARWIQLVVDVESPVHVDEVARRMREAVGLKQTGSRIRKAIHAAALWAARSSGMDIRKEGDFLWVGSMKIPPVRDRSELPLESKKLRLVAAREIAEAVREAVRRAYGIKPADLPGAVCKLLGFARTSGNMKSRINKRIAWMLKKGDLVLQDDHVFLPPEERPQPLNGDAHLGEAADLTLLDEEE